MSCFRNGSSYTITTHWHPSSSHMEQKQCMEHNRNSGSWAACLGGDVTSCYNTTPPVCKIDTSAPAAMTSQREGSKAGHQKPCCSYRSTQGDVCNLALFVPSCSTCPSSPKHQPPAHSSRCPIHGVFFSRAVLCGPLYSWHPAQAGIHFWSSLTRGGKAAVSMLRAALQL